MLLQNVDIKAVSSTVGSVTTIIGVLIHTGPPARTFFFGAQLPTGADEGATNATERRCIQQVVDQFCLWVQNGKPST